MVAARRRSARTSTTGSTSFPLDLPPLRERREDIPLLVEHFLRTRSRAGRADASTTIAPARWQLLRAYAWPGNIRELANVIERAAIVSTGPVLQLAEWATGQHVPVGRAAPAAAGSATPGLLEVEREHIARTLELTGWKVSGPGGAAEVLGLKPTTLEARMRKLGISRPGR